MRASLAVVALTLALAACGEAVTPPVRTATGEPSVEVTVAPRLEQTTTPTTVATPPRPPTPSPTTTSEGNLVLAAVGGLSKTLHPYPDSASYSQAWLDVAASVSGRDAGGGGLLSYGWHT